MTLVAVLGSELSTWCLNRNIEGPVFHNGSIAKTQSGRGRGICWSIDWHHRRPLTDAEDRDLNEAVTTLLVGTGPTFIGPLKHSKHTHYRYTLPAPPGEPPPDVDVLSWLVAVQPRPDNPTVVEYMTPQEAIWVWSFCKWLKEYEGRDPARRP